MVKQEFDKKELANSNRIFKSATPKYELSWYIKWVSSIVLIVGMILAANNLYPYNIVVQCAGILGWLVVSIMWNDRSLIIVNAVGAAILINGLVGYWLKG